jgi:hypothetical protein
MPRPKWTFSIDLDGILCESGPPEKYSVAKPRKENITMVNSLYDKGYTIIVHTGRGWHMYEMTKAWLLKHGVKHTELAMGKVVAHYYVDDRNADLAEVWRMFYVNDPDLHGKTIALSES